jgi:FeS assembly SUF system protein
MTDVGSADAEAAQAVSKEWNATEIEAIVVEALRTIYDPEIPVNIFDLGLIYKIDAAQAGFIEIDMTLTAPGCPVAGEMVSWVHKAVAALDSVSEVKVNLVFDPPWDQSKMSEESRLDLGLM